MTGKAQSAYLEAARSWLEQDPDEVTRAELQAIVSGAEAGDPASAAELESRFGTRLAFGTAGLRGPLGAGPNRMNRVLVSQAAAGFAAFLKQREEAPSIVIGYDARTNSELFARDTATIMAGAGVRTILLPRALPTPVLAFAVRHLDVSAGVMVTASHNPPRDNGYKVYLGGLDKGSQIVPPADAQIAAEIDRVAAGSIEQLPRSTDFIVSDEGVVAEYVTRTAAVGRAAAPLSFVYSPLHGVGWETSRAVFEAAGFGTPHTVEEQLQPDPAFPTVAFPNPEEPGAMDLTLALAERLDADLAIVNDPDADRLAVAVPTASGWRRLTGNEVGLLLGWRAAEKAVDGEGVLAASLVSSPGLAEVARSYRLDYADTLTGFKWISRVGGLRYGYEEALGYLVDPEKVLDKDGISAAVAFLAMASELKAAGSSVEQRLAEFTERFGAYASGQVSLRFTDVSQIAAIIARLRAQLPSHVGRLRVDRIDDFRDGFERFGPAELLRLWIGEGARVIIRPSGTEPKLKVYLDAWSTEGDAAARQAAADAVIAELDRGMRELLS